MAVIYNGVKFKSGLADKYAVLLRLIICAVIACSLAVEPACNSAVASSSATPSNSGEYAMTGTTAPGMESFESQLTGLLQSWAVPGASVAIAKDGRLVYARGFGWLDIENKEPMKPTTLVRIASVSKTITAVATLKLAEEGKLGLDQRAFEVLKELKPCTVGQHGVDPRIFEITIRQLLWMTAGWNRMHTGDPLFAPLVHHASYYCSPTLRADSVAIIRYWMSKPLDFNPGTDYAYSNLCYSVLEQVIKKASGMRYSEYVKQNILLPIGITDMRLGRTRIVLPDETLYYTFKGQNLANSYFPNVKGMVPLPYGGDFALEALSAPAGWIASSVDLVKFFSTLSGERAVKSPLSQKSLRTMLSCPDIEYWRNKKEYFGMGVEVLPVEDSTGTGYTFSRVGSFPGSMSFAIHRDDGITWSILVNSRPQDQYDFLREVKMLVTDAINHQKQWPNVDLFNQYK